MQIALIPQPRAVQPGEGTFSLDTHVAAAVPPGLDAVGNHLHDWLQSIAPEIRTSFASGSIENAQIELALTSETAPQEGYTLSISARGIRIQASQPAGLFYGLQTLRQLANREADDAIHFPVIEISDEPRYSWRGLLLDVARHFFPASFVKKLIDVMALYKFNVLQLHLTDDQGWRIAIDKLPRLAEIGSRRSASPLPATPKVTDGKPYGGYYTKDEIRDLVAYAQSRFVTILPEIEMPGHSVAALTAYPHLGCVGSGYTVWTQWGISPDVLCAGQESTYQYVSDVLDEVIDLFPGKYIHIGGDECPRRHWRECPYCQDTIRREALKDENELHGYFIRRVEQILEEKGRSLIGWDEIIEGGLAPNATVMSWRGTKGGIEAASAGHAVIMSPNTHVYLDHYQSQDRFSEPPAIGGFSSLKNVYSFDPDAGIPPESLHFVMGGQGNIWTEYIETGEHVEYMAFPRALALADVLWSRGERGDYARFISERLQTHLRILEALNVNFRQPTAADLL